MKHKDTILDLVEMIVNDRDTISPDDLRTILDLINENCASPCMEHPTIHHAHDSVYKVPWLSTKVMKCAPLLVWDSMICGCRAISFFGDLKSGRMDFYSPEDADSMPDAAVTFMRDDGEGGGEESCSILRRHCKRLLLVQCLSEEVKLPSGLEEFMTDADVPGPYTACSPDAAVIRALWLERELCRDDAAALFDVDCRMLSVMTYNSDLPHRLNHECRNGHTWCNTDWQGTNSMPRIACPMCAEPFIMGRSKIDQSRSE